MNESRVSIDIVTIIVHIISIMEATVTALEMRRKFGGVLDRVVQKGDHITIMRGHQAIATLVPAREHQQQCGSRDRVKTVREVLAQINEWKRKRPRIAKKMARTDSVSEIRQMRERR